MELKFKAPTRDEPGFLRRQRAASRLLTQGITPEIVDEMVEFLLPNVEEPADREEARTALLDASQEQFMGMMMVMLRGSLIGIDPKVNSNIDDGGGD